MFCPSLLEHTFLWIFAVIAILLAIYECKAHLSLSRKTKTIDDIFKDMGIDPRSIPETEHLGNGSFFDDEPYIYDRYDFSSEGYLIAKED